MEALKRQEEKKAYLKALEQYAAVSVSARKAGIARCTVASWRKEDVEFAEKEREIRQYARDILVTQVYREALNGDMDTARWLLSSPGWPFGPPAPAEVMQQGRENAIPLLKTAAKLQQEKG